MRTVSFLAMVLVAVSSTPLVRPHAVTEPAPPSRPELRLRVATPAPHRIAARQHARVHPRLAVKE